MIQRKIFRKHLIVLVKNIIIMNGKIKKIKSNLIHFWFKIPMQLCIYRNRRRKEVGYSMAFKQLTSKMLVFDQKPNNSIKCKKKFVDGKKMIMIVRIILNSAIFFINENCFDIFQIHMIYIKKYQELCLSISMCIFLFRNTLPFLA